jgi:hypothetical protein
LLLLQKQCKKSRSQGQGQGQGQGNTMAKRKRTIIDLQNTAQKTIISPGEILKKENKLT